MSEQRAKAIEDDLEKKRKTGYEAAGLPYTPLLKLYIYRPYRGITVRPGTYHITCYPISTMHSTEHW